MGKKKEKPVKKDLSWILSLFLPFRKRGNASSAPSAGQVEGVQFECQKEKRLSLYKQETLETLNPTINILNKLTLL